MWLWPSDQVVLDSPHSPDVLLARIASQTDPLPWLESRPNPTARPFEGWVEGGRFRIRPAWPGRRHSFRVYVEGAVEPQGTGSRVRARLHLDWAAVLYVAVVAGVVAAIAVVRPRLLGTAPPPWSFWLVYAVLAGLAWLMLMAAWWAGIGGARHLLSEVAGRSTGAAPPGAMDR